MSARSGGGAGEEVRRTFCPLDCPDACTLEATVRGDELVRLEGTRDNPATAGFLCDKVRRFDRHLRHELRLARPRVRAGPKGSGAFREVGWDEALELVAARLAEARRTSGGESILPFSYGGSNGALTQDSTDARLFRRLGASRLLRTVCAVPTTLAAEGMYGRMCGVGYEDYGRAELIVVWGANPPASGIHLVPFVNRALEAGARLVVVDPRRTKLARRADLHLALRPGTDLPLALAVIRELFESGAADLDFLAAHASGVDELRERADEWTLERAAETCDVPAADLAAFARLYADASPAVVRCGWGLERNRNGGSAVCAVLALPAVAGKFGVRGGGYTLSNAGAWKLAPVDDEPAQETRAINMNRLGRALLGELDPPVRVLFVYDANPLVTLPDQGRVQAGLEREDLFTVVFDQVLTDTARFADVVLPATTFLEHHELRKGYGVPLLQRGRPVLAPFGEARPNYAVFAELVRRLGLARDGDAETPDELEARLTRGLPELARADLERDGRAAPAYGTAPVQLVDVFPATPDGRIALVPAALDREAPGGLYRYRPDPAGPRHPLALISPSTHKRISSTFGELWRELVPLGMHPADAAARGLADGDPVRIHNDLGEIRTTLRIDPDLRPGVVELPKGLWTHNTANGWTSNRLVPDALADLGGGACFNDARVDVERAIGV